MELIIYILLVYGITNIIVYNTIPIYNKIYNFIYNISPNYLGKLLSCMMCCSTWVGFIISFLFIHFGYSNLSPFMSNGISNVYLAIFFDGCLASGTTWLIHTIQEYYEKQ